MSESIKRAINNRGAKHDGLSVNYEKLKRNVDYLYRYLPTLVNCALYVGVGHGHDAMLALLSKRVKRVVGVDPYFQEDGNDEEDYRELLALIDDNNLKECFEVYKLTVQDFIDQGLLSGFDLIVINDVLHHIFTTPAYLSKSNYYEDAVSFFKGLHLVSGDNCVLAVGEVQRHGLIPFLEYLGLKKSIVNYRTKQPWREWNRAIEQAGWNLYKKTYYVPYSLKGQERLFSTAILGPLVCRRYTLLYKKS